MKTRLNRDIEIWVINLDTATERMRRMASSLDAMGIPHRRLAAFRGTHIPEDRGYSVDYAGYERNMGQKILPGKVGCYFSHLFLWELLAESEKDFFLILEDDVVFHQDFPFAIEMALEGDRLWDLIRLNATRAIFPLKRGASGAYSVNAYLGRFTGNGAYILKKSLARRLSPSLTTMRRAFEYEIGRFYDYQYRLAGLEPFPSHVEDFGQSQITGYKNERLKKLPIRRRLPQLFFKAIGYFRRYRYLQSKSGWPHTRIHD